MQGKQKCTILKEIRRKIALENGIPYQTRDCTHTGECSGTCPFCESEVRYLESELKKKASLGKKVKIAAICAGMAAMVSGCSVVDSVVSQFSPTPTQPEEIEVLSGEVPWPNEIKATEVPTAESQKNTVPVPTSSTTVVQIVEDLSGYVPYGE